MLQLLPQYAGIDAQFLRDLLRQLVADDPAGHALDVGQQMIHGLLFAFAGADGKLCAGSLDEVVKIFLRILQRRGVGVFPFAADVEIGIETLFERQHFDLKLFFHQQSQGAVGGFRAGCVGIEVDDDILAEAAEQLGLQLGEGSTGTGNDVVKSGGVDGDAIHLAFDQNRVIEFAYPFLG